MTIIKGQFIGLLLFYSLQNIELILYFTSLHNTEINLGNEDENC